MPEINISNIMSKLTPAEQEKAILLQKAAKNYGRAGFDQAIKLLKETPTDSPAYDRQKMFQQIAEAIK